MKKGQVTIMLLLIIVLLVTITTAAVAVAVSTLKDTTAHSLGEDALTVAEAGAENAILLLLRNPDYAGEAGLPIGPGDATITVTGTNVKTINSVGTVGRMVRRIQVVANQSASELTLVSWQEY